MKKYEFVSAGNFDAFLADFSIRGGYDKLVFIREGDASGFYIAKNDEARLAKEGLRLYSDRRKIQAMIKKGAKAKQAADMTVTGDKTKSLRRKSNGEIKELWKQHLKPMMRLVRIYYRSEAFNCSLVEKTIRDFISKKIIDPGKANQCFSLLLKPSDDANAIFGRMGALNMLEAPATIRTLCESVREIGKARLLFRQTVNRSFVFMKMLIAEIARRNNLSAAQVEACSIDEIFRLLDGKITDLSEINKRAKLYVAFARGKKTVFHTDEKARKIIRRIRPETPQAAKEFFGSPASSGKARGRAIHVPNIFVNNGKDLREKTKLMKKGDILVANSTGPDMIAVCRKAAAIITNEGGINSHAAIISRELGIPCIVGTKIATKVIRDGDIVEIDADKGLVRIIRPAGNQ